MSSRIPLAYNPKVLELFRNPKNLGRMENPDAEAVAGSLACGDMIAIFLRIDAPTQTITEATFESYGCAANIAASSIMTVMAKGKTLEQAWQIELEEYLGRTRDASHGKIPLWYPCGWWSAPGNPELFQG